ncbi:hypothetical protein [Sharpea azabuensis]|uniref:hypothetical protein n=1 Tax=Sharpea azabuensis TaxID=322505 RepID=UPI002E7FF498|nr:hypothetical protein [Sharpea azabuensis]MEE3308429.1 hypothetical protein [Sharpea azabuensis]
MVVGPLGNKSPDSDRFTLVTPKPENGVRLQATPWQSELHGLAPGSSQTSKVIEPVDAYFHSNMTYTLNENYVIMQYQKICG